jgi:hypothetical protein
MPDSRGRLTIALVSIAMLFYPCPLTAHKYKPIPLPSHTNWTYWFAVASDFWSCCGVILLAKTMCQLICWSVVCYIMPAG